MDGGQCGYKFTLKTAKSEFHSLQFTFTHFIMFSIKCGIGLKRMQKKDRIKGKIADYLTSLQGKGCWP